MSSMNRKIARAMIRILPVALLAEVLNLALPSRKFDERSTQRWKSLHTKFRSLIIALDDSIGSDMFKSHPEDKSAPNLYMNDVRIHDDDHRWRRLVITLKVPRSFAPTNTLTTAPAVSLKYGKPFLRISRRTLNKSGFLPANSYGPS